MNLDISNANLIDNLNIDSYGYYNTRYSNAKGSVLVDVGLSTQPVMSEASALSETPVIESSNIQPVLQTTISGTETIVTSSPQLESVISQPAPISDTGSSTTPVFEQPATTPRYIQEGQITQTAVQQNIVPVVPTPIPSFPTGVGFGGGAMGGGAMGGGGTSPKTTSTSASKESGMLAKQAPLTDKNIFKRFWFWGLLIGAGAGYYYAKTKNKKVLDFTLIASAIGGGVGLGIEMAVKNKMEKK